MDILEREYFFVIGAARSGTTWVQRFIVAHPAVVSLNRELTVFSRYTAPMLARYKGEDSKIKEGKWEQGLPLIFDQPEFEDWLKVLIRDTYQKVVELDENASLILDKHPNYSRYVDHIKHFLPNAKFLHVIRDGRDVAASMMSVHKRVGHSPREINEAAESWRDFILNPRASNVANTKDYLEVRYEELLKDPKASMKCIFDFAGLDHSDSIVEQIEKTTFKERVSAPNTAVDSKRSDQGATWKAQLNLWQRYRFNQIAGDLLCELGYAQPGWWKLQGTDAVQIQMSLLKKRFRAVLRGTREGLRKELR